MEKTDAQDANWKKVSERIGRHSKVREPSLPHTPGTTDFHKRVHHRDRGRQVVSKTVLRQMYSKAQKG
jgi:hypothetical protein